MLSRVPLFATLWTDCCPTDSSVSGISQARILEWVAISSSRTKSWSSSVSCFSSKPASAPPTSVTYSQEESVQSVVPLSPRLLLCPLGFLQAQPGLLASVSGLRALSLWTQRRSPCSDPGASLLSDSARDAALTGSSYSSCLLFSILDLFSCYFLLLYTQLRHQTPADSILAQPTQSQLWGLWPPVSFGGQDT